MTDSIEEIIVLDDPKVKYLLTLTVRRNKKIYITRKFK